MASNPVPIIAPAAQWFDEPAARKVIAKIKRDDFRFDFHRNFITANGERQWLPETTLGFEIEEALDELRTGFVDRLAGFVCDENTSAEQMDDYLAVYNTQATIAEVIGAAIRERGHLGWRPCTQVEVDQAFSNWERAKAIADRNREDV